MLFRFEAKWVIVLLHSNTEPPLEIEPRTFSLQD